MKNKTSTIKFLTSIIKEIKLKISPSLLLIGYSIKLELYQFISGSSNNITNDLLYHIYESLKKIRGKITRSKLKIIIEQIGNLDTIFELNSSKTIQYRIYLLTLKFTKTIKIFISYFLLGLFLIGFIILIWFIVTIIISSYEFSIFQKLSQALLPYWVSDFQVPNYDTCILFSIVGITLSTIISIIAGKLTTIKSKIVKLVTTTEIFILFFMYLLMIINFGNLFSIFTEYHDYHIKTNADKYKISIDPYYGPQVISIYQADQNNDELLIKTVEPFSPLFSPRERKIETNINYTNTETLEIDFANKFSSSKNSEVIIPPGEYVFKFEKDTSDSKETSMYSSVYYPEYKHTIIENYSYSIIILSDIQFIVDENNIDYIYAYDTLNDSTNQKQEWFTKSSMYSNKKCITSEGSFLFYADYNEYDYKCYGQIIDSTTPYIGQKIENSSVTLLLPKGKITIKNFTGTE